MEKPQSIIDRITGVITSTTALITAVVALVTLLGGYGLITHNIIGSAPPNPPSSCTDNIQNGKETGVDCGGACAPCPTLGPFTNLKNVSLEGDRINKTAGGNNWNAGATAQKYLPAGVAGGVSYMIKNSDGHFLFGLTPNPGDASYEQIMFALAVQPGTGQKVQVNVFEKGINRSSSQPSINTEISISRTAEGEITYTVDGRRMIGVPATKYSGRLLLDLSIKQGSVSGFRFTGGWRKPN